MTTATLPLVWRGRSGREYVPSQKAKLRHGGMASVRKVIGRGGPVGTSVLEDGEPMALKEWREGDEASLDQLQQEARVLVELTAQGGDLPCPRLYDLVGDPLVTGLVMEWCPVDLDRWWRERATEPDAFGRLMAVLAEVARRLSEYHQFFGSRTAGIAVAHGDLKPSNILMSSEGRWLVSDFGAAIVRMPDDDVWADSHAIVATENFVAPEVLFGCRVKHAAALDSWSLGATLFALLKLKRMLDDESPMPRNGTHSPRFRMERVVRVLEVYGREPRRFQDRDLDPGAFQDPLRIPEEDRRVVRDALRGVFGVGPEAEVAEQEEQLTERVLEILDRALSIDPRHRYTDCRDVAAAFDALTREYIALSASAEATGSGPALPVPGVADIAAERDAAMLRSQALQDRVAALEEALLAARRTTPQPAGRGRSRQPPVWWSVALVLVLVMQAATLVAVALVMALQWPALGVP